MPKFKSDEAREQFRRKMQENAQWRIDVLTDLVLDVIPKKEKEGVPWRSLCRLAENHYKADPDAITQGDPMFETHKDTFIDAGKMYLRRSQIRRNALRRGRTICDACNKSGRIVGVFLSRSKKAIQRTYAHRHAVITGSADHINLETEIVDQKTGLQIGKLVLQLLLPALVDATE